MFTIIGGDGKEYGPVTTEQVRNWLAAGRANLDTKAKAAGSEEWRRLGDYAEFGGAGGPPLISGAEGDLSGGTERAERGTRLLARVIDTAIAAVAMLPGAFFFGGEFLRIVVAARQGQQPDLNDVNPTRLIIGVGLLLLALGTLAIVQIVMISTRGQTIGKRVTGIRIVRLRDGAPAGFVNGWVLRSLLPGVIGAIPWLGSLFALVDACFIFREDRRCIHDLMADTKVIKVPPTS